MVKEINGLNELKEVVNNNKKVVVDLWAPWCGPCRMMSPVIDEISDEIRNISFYKANVDEEQELATRFRVSGIPFFALFKDGKVVASRTGGASKEDFVDWLKEQAK